MSDIKSARDRINEIDKAMADLFCERMHEVGKIAKYKSENSLPLLDKAREDEIIDLRSSSFECPSLKEYYIDFLKHNISLSRSFQAKLYPELQSGILYEKDSVRKLHVSLGDDSYDVILGCGVLSDASNYLRLDRRVLIVTDSGVPRIYADTLAKACGEPLVYVLDEGEASKSMANFEKLLSLMAENCFTRGDCVVAVGGGMVGDLSGFAAASYMRGVDFYNIPTTLLSQVDSSIGGKVAIDLRGYKNTVGAFYQPKRVLIDPELLLTLDIRQIRSGLAESLKMAATSDAELFEMFESGDYLNDIEEVILRSLLIKRGIVERDVKEGGERKILNFGHTVGHAIESASTLLDSDDGLLHGECVALGMLYFCSPEVRERILSVINEMGLPTEVEFDKEQLFDIILRDKKANGSNITITFVNEIGKAELIKIPIKKIRDYLSLNDLEATNEEYDRKRPENYPVRRKPRVCNRGRSGRSFPWTKN